MWKAWKARLERVPLGIVAVAAVGVFFVLFGWGLNHPFLLDDLTKIVENPDIRSLANIPAKLVYPYHVYQVLQRNDPSRPLVFLLYTLIYSVVGVRPWLYHALNLFVHALSVSLVFGLARHFLRRYAAAAAGWGALIVASLYGFSPLLLGTVFYAYGLSDVLSGFLLLLSLGCLVLAPVSRLRQFGSVLALVGALACKQSAVVLPLLVVIWFWCEEPSMWRQRIRSLWPHVLVVAAYFLVRFAYFGGLGDLEGYGQAYPAGVYAWTQPLMGWKYLAKAVLPYNLTYDHFILAQHFSFPLLVGAFGAWLALLWVLVRGVLRDPHAPDTRVALFALLWFWICLAPTSSLLPTVDLFVERRAYPALLGGLLGLVVILVNRASRGLEVLMGVAVVFAALSWQRLELLASPEALWEHTLQIYPGSQRAMNSLANLYSERGALDRAESIFARSLALYPNDFVAHTNYGALLERSDNPHRNLDGALREFQLSQQLNPAVAENYYNIGRILQMQNHNQEALGWYQQSLERKPDFVPALNNIAAILMNSGQAEAARPYLLRALAREPGYEPARRNLEAIDARQTPARR
ncbi:MAG: tetratricopeptide repeat protein [Bdellovibrionales bacterium]|nr:tetratricopeptide repeat protein [Bdellovibrionales bacterium]